MQKELQEELYGFKTVRKLTVLKIQEEDIKEIVKMYHRDTPKERAQIRMRFKEMIKTDRDEYSNIIFSIRDRSRKLIGLVETETEDGETFAVGIWIPNKAKQVEYLKHLTDSFLEWCEYEFCPIQKISIIRSIKEMKSNPVEIEVDILARDIVIEKVS